MAKIYEAHIDHDALDAIEIAPATPRGRWLWGALFAAFMVAGVAAGLTLATGSFSNAVEAAQNGFASNETGELATN